MTRLPLDLNLLVAFDALMEHRSVSRAAKAVGRSQPAMSNALARLRATFHDPLLVRSGGGMRPTPNALQAHGAVRAALAGIETALAKVQAFDPATAARRFRIAMAEDAAFYLLPGLTAELTRAAPGIALQVLSTAHLAGWELVAAGEAEMSIGLAPAALPKGVVAQPLFAERLVVLGARGHPALKGERVGLADFLAWPQVSVQPSAATPSRVDVALEKAGHSRTVALSVPHMMVVPYLLPGTRLIACLAERMARRFAPRLQLTVCEPPLPLGPYAPALVWHQRFDQDRGHAWLRREIAARATDLGHVT
jgi:DNA-binding transcriptional LysR family regulator